MLGLASRLQLVQEEFQVSFAPGLWSEVSFYRYIYSTSLVPGTQALKRAWYTLSAHVQKEQ